MKKKALSVILISFIFLLLFASGCREEKVKESEIEPKEVETQEETIAPQKETPKEMEITLYFGDKEAQFLVPEIKSIPATQAVAKSALEELIKGPESEDKISLIPKGTKVLSISIQNEVAEVNLSKEFKEKYPLGSAAENILIYSIVNTLTEFPSIKKVHFLIEGEPLEVIGSNYDLANTYFERNENLIKK